MARNPWDTFTTTVSNAGSAIGEAADPTKDGNIIPIVSSLGLPYAVKKGIDWLGDEKADRDQRRVAASLEKDAAKAKEAEADAAAKKDLDKLDAITKKYGEDIAKQTDEYKRAISALENPFAPGNKIYVQKLQEYKDAGRLEIGNIRRATDEMSNRLQQQYTQGSEQAQAQHGTAAQGAANSAAMLSQTGLGATAGGIQQQLINSNGMQNAQSESLQYLKSIRDANTKNMLDQQNRELDVSYNTGIGAMDKAQNAAQGFYNTEYGRHGDLLSKGAAATDAIFAADTGNVGVNLAQHNNDSNKALAAQNALTAAQAARTAANNQLISSGIGAGTTIAAAAMGAGPAAKPIGDVAQTTTEVSMGEPSTVYNGQGGGGSNTVGQKTTPYSGGMNLTMTDPAAYAKARKNALA